MILVVAGLHDLPFDRLVRAAASLGGDEELVVQRGTSRVEVPGASTFESLSAQRLAKAYRDARIIIGQASPGVLFDAVAVGKTPILVPRRPELGEHVDDHQVQFSRFVSDRAVIVSDVSELAELVRGWDAEAHRCPVTGVDEDVVRTIGQVIEGVAAPGRRARLQQLLLGLLGR